MNVESVAPKIFLQCSQLLALLFMMLVSFPSFSQERVRLQVSSATKTLGYGPLWVASKVGFF